MSKIFKFNEFSINEAVAVKQVIEDVVDFFEKSPVVSFYPEDKDEVRMGWITKEHKLYSTAGIKKYFEEKYGKKYSALNIDNAINYTPSIKTLTKKLSDKGMTLQKTKIKGQFGQTLEFFSVDLSDTVLASVKEKYEEEFAKRYSKYMSDKKEAPKKSADAKASKAEEAKKAKKKAAKKKNEAFEFLIESLFTR